MKYELVPVSQDRVTSDSKTIHLQVRNQDGSFWDTLASCSEKLYNENDKAFDSLISKSLENDLQVRFLTVSVRQWETITEVWPKDEETPAEPRDVNSRMKPNQQRRGPGGVDLTGL